jgi:aldose 1-epimerase
MKLEQHTVASEHGDITVLRLTNDAGAYVVLSSLGAGILEVGVPDRDGKIENVALGYANAADYMADGPCMGKVPGRYANRIAKGKFSIVGQEYSLAINNGPNALHGGPTGFQNRIWDVHVIPNGVRFSYTSADGEEGYPGELKVRAEYVWSENNILDLYLWAATDKATVVNLTNHSYWNLRGAEAGSALAHKLTIKASCFLPTDDTLVPSGELAPVAGTPMDFTKARALGEMIHEDFPSLKYGKGYDSCWVINGWRKGFFTDAAVLLEEEESGRVLEIGTTQPGVQVYTGNWLAGSPKAHNGGEYADYDGVAIEAQGFPDAPNHPGFPSQLLLPGKNYDEHIRFKFYTK